MFLKSSQNSQDNTCNFIKKGILTRVFSCEFFEISKNTFVTENLRTTASRIRTVTSAYSCWIYETTTINI